MATKKPETDKALRSYSLVLLSHHGQLMSGREDDSITDAMESRLSELWEGLDENQRQQARGMSSDLNWVRRGYELPPKGKKREEVTPEEINEFYRCVDAKDQVAILQSLRTCAAALPPVAVAIARANAYVSLGYTELSEPFLKATIDLGIKANEPSRTAFDVLVHARPAGAFEKSSQIIQESPKDIYNIMSSDILIKYTDNLSVSDMRFHCDVSMILDGIVGDVTIPTSEIFEKLGSKYKVTKIRNMWRRLHGIEKKIGNHKLYHFSNKEGIKGLTVLGNSLRKLAENILNIVSQHSKPSHMLRIAASEAASTYLFPEALADRDDEGNQPSIQTGLFRRAMLKSDGILSKGKIDIAIAWKVYEKARSALVSANLLKGSPTQVVLIFHPLHPFGEWVAKHPQSSTPDQEYDKLLLNEIRKYKIVYPRALNRVVSRLVSSIFHDSKVPSERMSWKASNCSALESFPSVATHVRMKFCLGLFPGWKWLLGQLRREIHIQHVQLPIPKCDMSLMYYQLSGNEHRDSARFIQELEEKLAELNRDESDEVIWKPIKWNSPFAEQTQKTFRKVWSGYYINGGKEGSMPIPHWRQGKWTFDPIVFDGTYPVRCTGEFLMGPAKDEKGVPNRYRLKMKLYQRYLRVASYHEDENDNPDEMPAFLRFTKVFGRKPVYAGGFAEMMILGLIYVPQEEYSTVAPFILCSRETVLGAQDFRQISNLIQFYTSGDLGRLRTIPPI